MTASTATQIPHPGHARTPHTIGGLRAWTMVRGPADRCHRCRTTCSDREHRPLAAFLSLRLDTATDDMCVLRDASA